MLSTEQINKRVLSIDILRGLVMVIMALDHVRDFFHNAAMVQDPMDIQTTTPFLYFTRWITHYCAPIFIFLSGISAYLSGLKKSKNEQAMHLIKRGLFLVVFEITVITFGWTFNPFFNLMVLQVIWAIGFSMIVLGLMSYLPLPYIMSISFVILFGHNLIDAVESSHKGVLAFIWDVLIRGGFAFYPFNNSQAFLVVYPALPWTGIMMLGYCIGRWYESGFDSGKRKQYLLISGITSLVFLIVLRGFNIYGNPTDWQMRPEFDKNLMAFLHLSKYPPSLLYTCMTLGPGLIFLALTENTVNRFSKWMTVFGKAPMFYYVLHIYTIHVFCVILFYASGYGSENIVSKGSFFNFRPAEMGFELPLVYLIWIGVVVCLYFPCVWYASYKQSRKHWLFRYV